MTVDGPLLLIDVDGVLNPWFRCHPPFCHCHPGWIRARSFRGRYKLVLNPAHGPQLLALAADTGAELAWHTSWEDEANIEVGPRIGLPVLPVVPYPPLPPTGRNACLTLGVWKARCAVAYAGTRPTAWLEDEPDAPAEVARLAKGPFRVVLTDERTGLGDDHLAEAREFLTGLGAGTAN